MQNDNNKIEPLLTSENVAAIFQVRESTLRRWVTLARKGKSSAPLPIKGASRRLLWRAEDIRKFIESDGE